MYTFLLPLRPVFEDHSHCLRWSSLPLAVHSVGQMPLSHPSSSTRKYERVYHTLHSSLCSFLHPRVFSQNCSVCICVYPPNLLRKTEGWRLTRGRRKCAGVIPARVYWSLGTTLPLGYHLLLLAYPPPLPPLMSANPAIHHLSQHPSSPRTTPHIYSHLNTFWYDYLLSHDSMFILSFFLLFF